MRTQRLAMGLILGFVCVGAQAQTTERAITVTGRLTRAVGIGGESTGWVIQLEAETSIDGKQVQVLEFLPKKKENPEFMFDYFTIEDLNFWGKLSNEQVEKFTKINFDYLFNYLLPRTGTDRSI